MRIQFLAILILLPMITHAEDEIINQHRSSYKKHDSYKSVEFNTLKAGTKQYKHKKVYYEGSYLGFLDRFPEYVEDSGFESEKYFALNVVSLDIPVMIKKDKDNIALFAALKKGAKVRVYGRLKEFRKESKRGMLPNYYVDLDYIQILNPEPAEDFRDNQDRNKFRDGKRHRRQR